MTKLFVGGLPYSVNNQQLEEMFAKFGSVASANVVTDKFSGQSKGFGFVEMPNDNEAQAAIKELDGYAIEGRKIGVSVARPREDNRGGFSNHGNGNNRGNFQRGGYRR